MVAPTPCLSYIVQNKKEKPQVLVSICEEWLKKYRFIMKKCQEKSLLKKSDTYFKLAELPADFGILAHNSLYKFVSPSCCTDGAIIFRWHVLINLK
jgi:hypothetical protein